MAFPLERCLVDDFGPGREIDATAFRSKGSTR